mgnify:FL=1
MTRYEPHCDCLGGHVSMASDPNGRWCRADEGWKDISTAPYGASGRPSTYFIGARRDGDRINVATCYRNEHGAYEWWGGGMTPTHWMPLPLSLIHI